MNAKAALFGLSELNDNMHLIIRIATVLQGPVDDIAKTYSGGKLSQKDHAKWHESMLRAVRYLGAHTQGLGWAAVRLTAAGSQKAIALENYPIQFFREKDGMDDGFIFDALVSAEEKQKRLKPLEITLTASFRPVSSDSLSSIKHLTDPSLIPYSSNNAGTPVAAQVRANMLRSLCARY